MMVTSQPPHSPPGLSAPLLKRLELSKSKLEKLANGIRKIAEQEEPLGKPRRRVEVAQGMQLEQVTCALGVILVIFESRPDALPQIASLALRAGCGVILKGGKEAKRSNTLLHSVCSSAASEHVSRGLIHLVQDREAVSELLGMDGKIDLVVPRGGPDLVKSITQQTSLPVLGHSDGICHLYLHSDCDPDMAKRLAVDSKCDYPAACNAMETLLVHEHLVRSGVAQSVVEDLKANGVALNGGQKAMEALGIDRPVSSFSFEYGDKECAVEVVTSLQEAISFINRHGSSHTDAIVATDERDQKEFLSKVDSACVFANCSTRFSDGYRFGLGAEVSSPFSFILVFGVKDGWAPMSERCC